MILQDELFDEHELGGHGGAHKQPVLLREDLNGGGGRNGGSLLRENEALLQQVTIIYSLFQLKSTQAVTKKGAHVKKKMKKCKQILSTFPIPLFSSNLVLL